MNKAERCGDSSRSYEALGWFGLGLASGALLLALTFPFSIDFAGQVPGGSERVNWSAFVTVVLCWALFAIGGVVGPLSLCLARTHRRDRAGLRRDVVLDEEARTRWYALPSRN